MYSQCKQTNNSEPLIGSINILMAFYTFIAGNIIPPQKLSCAFCVGFVLDLRASSLIDLLRTHNVHSEPLQIDNAFEKLLI